MGENFMNQAPAPQKQESMIGDKIAAITSSIEEIRGASSKTQKERLFEELSEKLKGNEFTDVSDFFLGTEKIQSALTELVRDSLKTNTLNASMLKKLTNLRGFSTDFFDRDSELKSLLQEKFESDLHNLEQQDDYSFVKTIVDKKLLPGQKIKSLVSKAYAHMVVNQLSGDTHFTDENIRTIKRLNAVSEEDLHGALGRAYNEFLDSYTGSNASQTYQEFDKNFRAKYPEIVSAVKGHRKEQKAEEKALKKETIAE